MIKARLSPTASLLYYWIQCHLKVHEKQRLDLEAFQAWTGEFLDVSASMGEICSSLYKLNRLGLITIEGTEVRLNDLPDSSSVEIPSLNQLESIPCQRSYENNPLVWGLFMAVSFLVLWSGSFALSARLNQFNPSGAIAMDVHSVLGEKLD